MNVRSLFLFAVLVFLAGAATGAEDDPAGISAALKQADRRFKEQNWAEAGKQHGSVRTRLADRRAPAMRRAVEGEVACAVKLTRWDDAVGQLAADIDHNLDTLNAVAGQRLLAGLYLSMPHGGVQQGGRFLRGESGQGTSVDREESDEQEAVTRLERARDVAARLAAAPPAGAPGTDRQEIEQAWIDTNFDLTTAMRSFLAVARRCSG